MKKEMIGFLLFVILTSSFYVMIPDVVRIDIQETKSEFRVYENDEWVLSGTEWVNLFDGVAKMRAKERSLTESVNGTEITITRFALYKDNITVHEIYMFNGNTTDVKLFPISHSIQVLNGQGKILQYEVKDLLYSGETVKDITSPQKFGYQMKVEWDAGNYYSRIYKYIGQDKGKLTVKYKLTESDETYNVRLFDPPTEIDSCQTLNSANTNYILNKSVNTSGTCMTIGAENITLDGAGYTINYSQSDAGYGIYSSGYDNNIIKNLNIIKGSTSALAGGIYFTNVVNNTLYNNTINIYMSGSASLGIYLSSSDNNNISYNYINTYGGSSNAVYLLNSDNNTLYNNYMIANGSLSSSVGLSSSYNNTFSGGSYNSNNYYDYHLLNSGFNNNFTETNFTIQRRIYFDDTVSWFNYNNDSTENIMFKTQVDVADKYIDRTLINWSNESIIWNDTMSSTLNVTYNFTDLLSLTYYNVTFISSTDYSQELIKTDSNGDVSIDFLVYGNNNTQLTLKFYPLLLITLNSPTDNTYSSDNTPNFVFTVNENVTNYTCELIVNDINYGSLIDTWSSNTSIVSGASDVGLSSTPEIFNISSTYYLISGEISGTFVGYNWTGSAWQSDTAIINGLLDAGSISTISVFSNNSDVFAIAGHVGGTFVGYNWTGSTWQLDSQIVSLLGDVGENSAPTIFFNDAVMYLISGNNSGQFSGYNWTGIVWQEDLKIVSGLIDVGVNSRPEVFFNNSIMYLISGANSGGFTSYKHNGSEWISDYTLSEGLNSVVSNSHPSIFEWDNVKRLITGETNGNFYGYDLRMNYFIDHIITANTSISDGSFEWYVSCDSDVVNNISNVSDTRTIIIDTTVPLIEFESPTESNNSYINTNYYYINTNVTETNVDTYILNWNGTNETMSNDYINKTTLTDGNYTYYVYVNDSVGYSNQTETRTIVIDTTNPLITFNSPSNNINTTNVSILINWSVSDVNLGTVILSFNGVNVTIENPSTNLTYNVTNLNKSIYTYYVWVNDSANNANQTTTQTITVINESNVVAFADGTDVLQFYIIDVNGTYKGIGQTDSVPAINITNNGNIAQIINISVNSSIDSCANFYVSNDSSLNVSVDYDITNTNQTVYTNLGYNTSVSFWSWVVLNSCSYNTIFEYEFYIDSYIDPSYVS